MTRRRKQMWVKKNLNVMKKLQYYKNLFPNVPSNMLFNSEDQSFYASFQHLDQTRTLAQFQTMIPTNIQRINKRTQRTIENG